MEDNQQQDSSVDKLNNLTSKAQGVKNAIRRVQKVKGYISKTEFIAASSEIWVPILLILLIIILLVVLIATIFGGTQNVNAGQQALCSSISGSSCVNQGANCPAGTRPDDSGNYTCSTSASNSSASGNSQTCCLPPTTNYCDPNNPGQSLSQNFNIIASSSFTSSQLLEICQDLSIPGQSAKYLSLLKSAGPTPLSKDSVGCGGSTYSSGITLHNYPSCLSASYWPKVIVHETGHVLAIGIGRLYQSFYSSAYYPSDPSCYEYCSAATYHYYLRSYAPMCGGGSGLAESFAESLAEYVFSRTPLTNYPSQCPVGYNWEKANIFGGYQF